MSRSTLPWLLLVGLIPSTDMITPLYHMILFYKAYLSKTGYQIPTSCLIDWNPSHTPFGGLCIKKLCLSRALCPAEFSVTHWGFISLTRSTVLTLDPPESWLKHLSLQSQHIIWDLNCSWFLTDLILLTAPPLNLSTLYTKYHFFARILFTYKMQSYKLQRLAIKRWLRSLLFK